MARQLLATILYEDQRGPTNRFPLHEFILRCLCDQCAIDSHDFFQVTSTIDGQQMKGDSKLLSAVRKDLPKIAADGRPVIAMFDNDRIRRLLKLPDHASDEEVFAAIRQDGGAQLHIVLLKQNTESIFFAAHECAKAIGVELDPEMLHAATVKKQPAARDALFTRISKVEHRALRDCIREHLASLAPLFENLRQILGQILPLNAGPQ